MVSSLPQGRLAVRYPGLQPLLTRMNLLVTLQRPGIPYCNEMMDFVPATPLDAVKA
jgi:hypothetical protein